MIEPQRILTILEKSGTKLLTGAMPNIVYLEDVDDNGSPLPKRIGKWDDWCILLSLATDKPEIIFRAQATTAAGLGPVLRKAGKGGVGRINPGYHHEKWRYGYHKWNPDHPALRQVEPTLFSRDNNGDGERSGDKIIDALIYAHQHGTNPKFAGENVGNFSEACMVRRFWNSHLRFIHIVTSNPEWHPKYLFSSTIITQKEWTQSASPALPAI